MAGQASSTVRRSDLRAARVVVATSNDLSEVRTSALQLATQASDTGDQLALVRGQYARLLAAARASVAAHRAGERGAWLHLEHELGANGQLPMPGQRAAEVLADAAASFAIMATPHPQP